MKKNIIGCVIFSFIFLFYSTVRAENEVNRIDFQILFQDWTKAFNQKQFPEVCELFSKSIIADYQGAERKNYAMMCDGFKKIFDEKERRYRNHFKIHDVYQAGNLAAVRITWYLETYKNDQLVSSIQEEGLDIFKKESDAKWRIVNFIAYPVK